MGMSENAGQCGLAFLVCERHGFNPQHCSSEKGNGKGRKPEGKADNANFDCRTNSLCGFEQNKTFPQPAICSPVFWPHAWHLYIFRGPNE